MNDTINFCTLFNSKYAARGLALYKSLEKHCDCFHLYVFAFDDDVYVALKKFQLKYATIIPLGDFEDDRLKKVKKERTTREYCWTCEALTVQYCFANYQIDNCTYLDADIVFFANPKLLISEMGDDDVLLTEHRYSTDKYYGGRFCVQFVTFKRTQNGMNVLNWWCDRVLEWCHEYEEDGKFGDQMYLNDWPERFSGIHVLEHLGGGVAPWNNMNYSFFKRGSEIWGIDKKDGVEFPVVFYHFHYLNISEVVFHIHKLYLSNIIRYAEFHIGGYMVSSEVIDLIYKPYVKKLIQCERKFDSCLNAIGMVGAECVSLLKLRRWKRLKKQDSTETYLHHWIRR